LEKYDLAMVDEVPTISQSALDEYESADPSGLFKDICNFSDTLPYPISYVQITSQPVRTAFLFARMLNLKYLQGTNHIKDSMRNYHYTAKLTHILHVSLLVSQLAGDAAPFEETFCAGLLHDSEDFKVLSDIYDTAKAYFLKKLNDGEPIEEDVLKFEAKELIVEGRNIGKEYYDTREYLLNRISEEVFKDTKSADFLKESIEGVTKKPWEGIGKYNHAYFNRIITLGMDYKAIFSEKKSALHASLRNIEKLSDRLQNTDSDFDIIVHPNNLIKRLHSLYESMVAINSSKQFMFEGICHTLNLSYEQKEEFLSLLRTKNPNQGQADTLSAYLASFHNLSASELEDSVPKFCTVYDTTNSLIKRVSDEINKIYDYLTEGEFFKQIYIEDQLKGRTFSSRRERADYIRQIISEDTYDRIELFAIGMKEVVKSAIPTINGLMIDYFNVGGYLIRTSQGHEWPDNEERRLDGFLDRISQMLGKKDYGVYDNLITPEGVREFAVDILAGIGGIMTTFQGAELVSLTDGRTKAQYHENEIYLKPATGTGILYL
ncbi:MAG: hypothetical protein NDI94_06335, partial [Candidatus Woesearchaeota archaeon]|nr:hypothetical protein [Candidatus Woesearchaeota archaeon]